MTYEEITEQTTETLTYLMNEATSASGKHNAEMFCNAAWGALVLWRDITHKMEKNNLKAKRKNFNLTETINLQDAEFKKLIDRQLLKDMETR
ncbi:hypothetical protein KCQ_05586 [Pectobacterium atrosepticum ICMP 1526]|uniref:hypothetical protein n=1 Tax=Pectobacterium atrosepticum TaxID=29471 RepID=UPI000500F856|nr:hypothetical protein [Pectobacterium atrosepticum]KFX10712.1 hypothetical protein JV34_22575 [Pectobacterium atrosepticum]KMK87256.1 hypothetical protein KCQ_05586 [Pectobacterium atrosepticum ICMP 1526]